MPQSQRRDVNQDLGARPSSVPAPWQLRRECVPTSASSDRRRRTTHEHWDRAESGSCTSSVGAYRTAWLCAVLTAPARPTASPRAGARRRAAPRARRLRAADIASGVIHVRHQLSRIGGELVERRTSSALCKPEVAGSIPARSTIRKPCWCGAFSLENLVEFAAWRPAGPLTSGCR
jgi:hypothetical protein